MRKIRRLKIEAANAAADRGHSMSVFRTVARPNSIMSVQGTVAVAECANCGAWVRVETRPMPNGIEICGNAIALQCRERRDLFDSEYVDAAIRLYGAQNVIDFPEYPKVYKTFSLNGAWVDARVYVEDKQVMRRGL